MLSNALVQLDNSSSRVDAAFVMQRCTQFLTDEQLLSQLNAPEQWQPIGCGSYGSIFRAQWFGCDVAIKSEMQVKVLDSSSSSSNSSSSESEGEGEAELLQEMALHASLTHPHIISFYVASPSYIVLEYAGAGDLASYMRKQTVPPPAAQRAQWCLQLLSAVHYMHNFGIMHSDISLSNVLVADNGTVKLADLGAAYLARRQPLNMVMTDQFMPLDALARCAPVPPAAVRDRYAVSLVAACILKWSADPFAVCGLPDFFERQLMQCKAADRPALIAQAMATAVQAVCMDTFKAEAELTPEQQQQFCDMFTSCCVTY